MTTRKEQQVMADRLKMNKEAIKFLHTEWQKWALNNHQHMRVAGTNMKPHGSL